MKFAFYSSMSGVNWGGSEELWWQAAMRLIDEGHQVAVNFKWWPKASSKLIELQKAGGSVLFRDRPPKKQWRSIPLNAFRCLVPSKESKASWLSTQRPDFLLITLGYHIDRVPLADHCREHGIPYGIQVQSASFHTFTNAEHLKSFREAYQHAERIFVVSQENLEKLQINLGMKLDNAELVHNPFSVPWDCSPSWPESQTLRLACVGRIHFPSKGQDLLVDVLRRPHWRDRDLEIVIYGNDQGHQQQLRDLIRLYGLEDRIRFGGYHDNVEALWRDYHGLILCSRYEGAAIVVVEAMMAHRMVISTETGRNRELIDEGESGFLAPAATADLLDAAMNRAWEARHRWREMGLRAGHDIRERFPADPVGHFKERLLSMVSPKRPAPVAESVVT